LYHEKGSKDVDHSLVSQNDLSQNNGSLGWGPGPGKVGPKVAKTCPRCDVTPRKPQTQNETYFFNLNSKTCWIHRCFEQLSSPISWRVMALQTVSKLGQKSGPRGT